MIITKTPLRISFMGGGTDIPDYYREYGGEVISTTIDKFIYVTINKRHDDKIRLGYSEIETVTNVDDLKHELIREALKTFGVKNGVEITTIADIPSTGSGLGASSSVSVGTLLALYQYCHNDFTFPDLDTLAWEASSIEINSCNKPIGKQDQYAAAFGGLNRICFHPDEATSVLPLYGNEMKIKQISDSLMLFHTGIARKASEILRKQKSEMSQKIEYLHKMKNLVNSVKSAVNNGNVEGFGTLLHIGWMYKKELCDSISNIKIDAMYEKAVEAGAYGGKVCGAGGGGHLLLCCEPDRQDNVRNALSGLNELPFKFYDKGAHVLYNDCEDKSCYR